MNAPAILAVTIAVLVVGRVLLAVEQARAASPRERTSRAGAGRGSGLLRFVAVWLLLAPGLGWLALAPPRMAATYVPGMVLLGFAALWPLTRYVLVPLGLVKAAYWVAWFSVRNKSEERAGASQLAASMALHRKADFDQDAASWLEERIQESAQIRGGTIAAAAATAAVRGDAEGARALFDSVRTLDPKVCPRSARHTAAEWLAADAASRGAWEQVIEIAGDPAGAGRSANLLAGVAKRLLGKPDAPGRATLVRLWLTAPRRRQSFAIVERALSVADGDAPIDDDDDDAVVPRAPDGDLLGRALAAHAALLSAKKPKPADVARVGRAFDAAFEDDSLAAHVDERAEALGATRAGSVLARLRSDVETSLFELLKKHRIALDDTVDELGDVAARAQRRLRDETLTVIEALSDAIRNRVRDKRALSPIDEWREWSALRMAYERGVLLGGPELRYLAFTKVQSDVCALAVWLFNDRKEKPIANAMFRFLLAEATATGDADGITLQTKNVGCGVD